MDDSAPSNFKKSAYASKNGISAVKGATNTSNAKLSSALAAANNSMFEDAQHESEERIVNSGSRSALGNVLDEEQSYQ